MKPAAVILDTGPLVAWPCRSDRWHAWAAEPFERLQPPQPLLGGKSPQWPACHVLQLGFADRSQLGDELLIRYDNCHSDASSTTLAL